MDKELKEYQMLMEKYGKNKERVLSYFSENKISVVKTHFKGGRSLIELTYNKWLRHPTVMILMDAEIYGLVQEKNATKDEEARKSEGWLGVNKTDRDIVLLNGREVK